MGQAQDPGLDSPADLQRDVEVTAARLIARDDLVARLDRAAARRVTIICAPAGSGKTSLLRAWADRPGRPHRLAVVTVQRGQQDAQLFWPGRRCCTSGPRDGPRACGSR